jgi:hypothetical protein
LPRTSRASVGERTDRTYAPESLIIDEVARFEGMSDPGDQSAVFALRSIEDGVLGTYTVAFGPDMDVSDAKVVPRLQQSGGRPPA